MQKFIEVGSSLLKLFKISDNFWDMLYIPGNI